MCRSGRLWNDVRLGNADCLYLAVRLCFFWYLQISHNTASSWSKKRFAGVKLHLSFKNTVAHSIKLPFIAHPINTAPRFLPRPSLKLATTVTNYKTPPSPLSLLSHFKMPCKHVLNSTVSIRAPCCLKWFECFECHDEFMDHPMTTSPILTLACLCCRMLFKKDLALFGDQDEICPHCSQRWIKPGETNEGFLFGMFQEEFDRMIDFGES